MSFKNTAYMTSKKFISICIPSYNRPKELVRLLRSIDIQENEEVEIVICEDKSLKREETRKEVSTFKEKTEYTVVYKENETNLGYDRILQELIRSASGEWIIFMGDDDEFVPGALDKLITFLKKHDDIGYVLRSYYLIHEDGKRESFRYYNGTRFFEPGMETYVSLFRKSVFVSGFTIRRKYIHPFLTSRFDGTLLFQLYLVAEVALRHRCAYFDEPLTIQYEGGYPSFGNSDVEKELYVPGPATVENSINFLKGFSKIAEFIDKEHNFNTATVIRKDMSKYSYPILSIQRNKGLRVFFEYVGKLNKLGFNVTAYYYLYVLFLTLLGKRICDTGIRMIKNFLGRTPRL